ncbi:CAMTA2 isoform 8, partial [Pan troglodytes]
KDTTEVAENSHHLKIFLPKKLLECLPRCPLLPPERLRWNTNEEIASYLITFEKHDEWLSCAPKTRPQNGSIILYNRKKVKYRKDGYLWKKRKDGKTTREDHMKLKVQGMEQRPSRVAEVVPGGVVGTAEAHVSWHQVELREWNRRVLCRTPGAADFGHPPNQGCSPNPRLSLQWGAWF